MTGKVDRPKGEMGCPSEVFFSLHLSNSVFEQTFHLYTLMSREILDRHTFQIAQLFKSREKPICCLGPVLSRPSFLSSSLTTTTVGRTIGPDRFSKVHEWTATPLYQRNICSLAQPGEKKFRQANHSVWGNLGKWGAKDCLGSSSSWQRPAMFKGNY